MRAPVMLRNHERLQQMPLRLLRQVDGIAMATVLTGYAVEAGGAVVVVEELVVELFGLD